MSTPVVVVSGAGTPGPRGSGWLSGTGAPPNSSGLDGDFYLDTSNVGVYYGPKTAGSWGSAHPFTGPLTNYSATTGPTVSNDSTQGYSRGSIWINTTTNLVYTCTSNAVGAAVWVQTLPAGPSGGSVSVTNAPGTNKLLTSTSSTSSTWVVPPWLAPSTGWVSGGNMTINGSNPAAFDVPASLGYIVDAVTDPTNPVVTTINLPPTTHVISGTDLTRAVNWWMVDSSGTIFSVGSSEPTDVQRRQYLQLGPTGAALTPSYSIISTLPAPVVMVQGYNQFQDLINNLGPFAVSGNQIVGNANLTFGITTGPTFFPNFSAATTPRNPHIVQTPSGMNPAQFRYATQVSGSENGPLTTAFDPTHYDVNGTVTLVGGGTNTSTIQRVWLFGTGTIGTNLVVQYGQKTYASLSAAQAAISASTYIPNPDFVNVGVLIGWIVTTKACTSLQDTANCTIVLAGKFATP